jgi:hypothetical protein
MKKCFKCLKNKNKSEFYKHSRMADGYLNKCIECTKLDVKKRRCKKIDEIRAYDRARSKTEKRVKHITDNTRKYRANNPEKYRAHGIVARAIRSGKMERRNCEVCDSQKSHAHHDDYSKPLDVIWLCALHHSELHMLLNQQKANTGEF